jgi:hypothetical protein
MFYGKLTVYVLPTTENINKESERSGAENDDIYSSY